MAIVDLGITTAELGMAVAEAAGDAASTTVCNGPFPCVTAPIPSTIAASAANIAIATANEVSAGINVATAGVNEGIAITNVGLAGDNVGLAQANLALAQTNKAIVEQNKQTFINTHNLLIGVTYASGAGDYAEYLPKLDLSENFRPGEVLGMKNGKVTRNTLNADRIMVVSFKPAVLGALPEEGTEKDFVKVAFLGQILTKVQGEVTKGDYILPSGFHNGFAIAKDPSEMLLSDYKKILGVAWSDSNTDGTGYVNVAVGLNMNDMSGIIQEQQKELQELKGQMEILADLVPGFREAANLNSTTKGSNNVVAHTEGHNDHEGHSHDAEIRTQHNSDMVTPTLSDIIYYVPTQDDFETGLAVARKIFEDRGVDMQSHPFWNRLDTDPDYKEEVFRTMSIEMKDALHYHVEVDSKN